MNVLLYRVGRNLNRVYRTCEAFGVESLLLLECDATLSGNLYKAVGRVQVEAVSAWPSPIGVLALETSYHEPLWAPSWRWQSIHTIVVGGETSGLPRLEAEWKATIPMYGKISGLTVEAALAIALYEWRRSSGAI